MDRDQGCSWLSHRAPLRAHRFNETVPEMSSERIITSSFRCRENDGFAHHYRIRETSEWSDCLFGMFIGLAGARLVADVVDGAVARQVKEHGKHRTSYDVDRFKTETSYDVDLR
nr:hypothetical protein SHINE37_40420 [Rhizobiaceae bacterium]